jgi:hypothetical protein
MAGSVTGSIGSNDVLLKNMATEETLFQILEALDGATITAKPATAGNTSATEDNTKNKKKNTDAVRSSSKALEKMFNGLEGIGRVIRGMDSNINNASYAFQAMSRGTGGFSKAMEFAANSVAQLQEQFSAYGKLMQVGGAVTDDFRDLRIQAVELGTDLQGVVKITGEYGQSLKSGGVSVRDTLAKMRGQFALLEDDQIKQYGRLGIGMNQITEQMLLTAEGQGGYNAVLARYKNNTGAMNAGMLKSTQELTLFASAIGMNSKMMQDEAAKAAQKINNKVFLANLSEAEQKQVQALQGLTGSADSAISVMRAMKTGFVDEQAATFLSTQNILGFGKEISNLMGLLKEGKGFPEALKASGLLEKANSLSPQQLSNFGTQMTAYAGAMPEMAASMGGLLTFINNMRGAKPEDIDKRWADILAPVDKLAPKTIDSYSTLLQEQNQLAKSTAALNTQINRMGLSFALALTKTTNSTVKAAAGSKEKMIEYFNQLLPEGMSLPPEILAKINDNLEAGVQADIEKYITQKWKETYKTTPDEPTKPRQRVTLRNTGLDRTTGIPVKMADGSVMFLNASDLVENRNNIQAQTNAFSGGEQNAGTVATGAILANKVPTISAITAAKDDYHKNSPNSAHNRGMALDFGIARRGGEEVTDTAKSTIDAMHEVMKQYGLTAGTDYRIDDESTRPAGKRGEHWTAPHLHMEILRPEAADKMRELFKAQMPKDQKQGALEPGKEVGGPNSGVRQLAETANDIKVSQADTGNVVNNTNDAILAALLDNKETYIQEMRNLGRQFESVIAQSSIG